MDYLLELRKRLLFCLLITLMVFTVLCFFANSLYQLLAHPLIQQLPDPHLIATKIAATFLVPMKFVFILSLFILMPLFFFQLWSFISPALYKRERKNIWWLLVPSVFLFYVGVLFGYFVVLPVVFRFFVHTTPANVALLPDIGQYLDFSMQTLFAFGLAFQVPVIVLILVFFNIYSWAELKLARRYVIVMAFVLGMVFSPPDIFSQTLLAIPMWLLYEVGLLLAKFMQNSKKIQSRPE